MGEVIDLEKYRKRREQRERLAWLNEMMADSGAQFYPGEARGRLPPGEAYDQPRELLDEDLAAAGRLPTVDSVMAELRQLEEEALGPFDDSESRENED